MSTSAALDFVKGFNLRNIENLLRELLQHYKKWWVVYLLAIASWALFATHFKFAVNASYSLPGTLYLVVKDSSPVRGEPMAFKWQDPAKKTVFPDGVTFLKLAGGMPGDIVLRTDSQLLVNQYAVTPKEFSNKGAKLEPNSFSGVIPADYFFAVGTHKDSLDSRYAAVGLIERSRVIGRAYVLF